MALQLSEVPDHPGLIAATKIGVFVTGGVFFLDFSRPLQPLWKPGLLIRWFRSPIGVLVPLVHDTLWRLCYRHPPQRSVLRTSSYPVEDALPIRTTITGARSNRTENHCRLRKAIPGGQPGMPCRMAFTGLNSSGKGQILQV